MFRIYFIIFLLLFTNQVIGQDINLENLQADYMTKFERFSVETGLSNNRCFSVFQDRFGYLWIGTENGLNRFDGYEFVHYQQNNNDSLSLSGNFISGISEDIYGNLWIATHSGLNLFQRETETFRHFVKEESKNSLRDNHIRAILADSIFLWIETLDGTLSKLNVETNDFEHFKHEKISQPYYTYHSLFKDNEGNIWIGGRNMGPCQFNPETKTFTYIEPGDIQKKQKRDRDVACYFIDQNQIFWITATDGIYQYNHKNKEFTRLLGVSTFSVIQDKKNNLWFGTGKGVIKFDYKLLKASLFLYDENNPHSLSDNHVNQVYEDSEGNIWVATDKGLNKLSQVKNAFGHYYHIPENINTLASNKVTSIAQDKDGDLWIGYKDKGFNRLNLHDLTIKHYNTTNQKELKSDRVSKLYFDSDNMLWIGLWQGVGFHKLNPENNQIKHYAIDPYSRKRDWYNDFLEDSENNFWIGFWGSSGMHLFNREKEEFEPDHFKPANKPLEQNITALACDNKYIWIGSDIGIIYNYNLASRQYSAYINGKHVYSEFNKLNYIPLFPFRVIEDIVVDHVNRTWFISDEGIILYNPLTGAFSAFPFPAKYKLQYINTNQNNSDVWFRSDTQLFRFNFNTKIFKMIEISPDFIDINNIQYILPSSSEYFIFTENTIFRAGKNFRQIESIQTNATTEINKVNENDEGIWIFTDTGILQYDHNLQNETGQIIHQDLKETEFYSLLKHRNNYWVGTNNGLFQLKEDKKILRFCSDPDLSGNIISEQILSLTKDPEENIWIGTDKGLCLYNSQKKEFKALNLPEDNSLTSHLVSDLMEDSGGNIWIATTNNGLNCLNPKTKKIKHFTFILSDTSSISSNEVNCIFEDNQNNLWVGTNDGLNVMKQNSEGFRRFTASDGLAGNQIKSIIQDDENNIWIGTDNGCSVFNFTDSAFKNYFYSDGMQSNQFNNAAIKLKTGEIVLGGDGGINIFTPSEIDLKYNEASIQITGFKIFDKLIRADFTHTERIALNYKENFFTLHFSALNQSNPQQHRYLYKLSKIDPDWVSTHDNQANYTDISPGKYFFHIKSISPDGYESKEKVLEIIIKPPFWQTIWFYSLVSIIILTIVGWIILLRINKLKTEKENVLLEQKLLRSQMNPHFIFNALFSIQNYIYLKDTENADRFLTKFARLLRLILENSRTATITIDNELQTITNYLDLQKMRFEGKFSYTIELSPEIDTEEIYIPPMLAQPFIENAIEHGFCEKGKSYHIAINIGLENKNIIYSIEDDGIGIEKSKQLIEFERKDHKSLGMKITKERLINLKKINKQNIHIDITDLSQENKQGTRVVFTIPLR